LIKGANDIFLYFLNRQYNICYQHTKLFLNLFYKDRFIGTFGDF